MGKATNLITLALFILFVAQATCAGDESDTRTNSETSSPLKATLTKCNMNGKIESLEACDDNNLVDGDGCNRNCQIEDGWACIAVTPLNKNFKISSC